MLNYRIFKPSSGSFGPLLVIWSHCHKIVTFKIYFFMRNPPSRWDLCCCQVLGFRIQKRPHNVRIFCRLQVTVKACGQVLQAGRFAKAQVSGGPIQKPIFFEELFMLLHFMVWGDHGKKKSCPRFWPINCSFCIFWDLQSFKLSFHNNSILDFCACFNK